MKSGGYMNPTILLVDDEPSICSALNRTFRKNKFDVYEANSAKQALQILKHNKIDVVLSDQRMPGMSGTELLSIVKDTYPTVGRIILSGYSDYQCLLDAINDAQISRFLPKPWNDEQLLEAVNHVVPKNKSDNVVPFCLPKKELRKEVTLSSSSSIAKYHDLPVYEDNFNKQHNLNIEYAIKNNVLTLKQQSYVSKDKTLIDVEYLSLAWIDFSTLNHEGVVNIANQLGCVHDLFAWYLVQVSNNVEQYKQSDKKVVVDLFFDAFFESPLAIKIIERLSHKLNNVVFRVSFEMLQKKEFPEFLKSVYLEDNSLLLNIGKRVLDIDDIVDTPIHFIEMDNKHTTINNDLLTEKRLKMISDAQSMQIKTLLSKACQQHQYNYARSMGFDYF